MLLPEKVDTTDGKAEGSIAATPALRSVEWFIIVGSSGALLFQNSMEAHIMRVSRTVEGDLYSITTAVFLMQLTKLIVCYCALLVQGSSPMDIGKHFSSLSRREWMILSVPAFMFTVQNNLRFVALEHMPSSYYQVLTQLKVLTTAIFSVIWLGRKISRIQWVSLVLLVCGVTLVEMEKIETADAGPGGSLDPTQGMSGALVGTLSVLTIVTLSGAAGAYTEGIAKENLNVRCTHTHMQTHAHAHTLVNKKAMNAHMYTPCEHRHV
jgi:UDP-sugar transporter A1/2/3